MLRSLCLALSALVLAAPAAWAVEAHYEAYAAGLEVLDMDARFDVSPDRYSVQIDLQTVGAFGMVLRSRSGTVVQGRFRGGQAAPERFFSSGTMRGTQRVTQIDYVDGRPTVRQLVPSNAGEREEVPAAEQAGTMDTLSAMAQLVRQVNETGRCDGRLTTFDGRRLSVLEARTSGEQTLEPTRRSSYAGPALRCDFTGRQTGGFMLDEDRDRLRQPQKGTAWFAAVTPGGPKIPVRVAFQTRWFGEATMYLAKKD